MVFRTFIASIALAANIPANAQTSKTYNMRFEIEDGKSIELPMSERGALPSENDLAKVQFAGPVVSKGNSPEAQLKWFFGLGLKVPAEEIAQIKVDDVSTTRVPILLVQDDTVMKSTKDGRWNAASQDIKVSADSPEWLYDDRATMLVVRIMIKQLQREPVTMYQLAYISRQAKSALRNTLRNAVTAR